MNNKVKFVELSPYFSHFNVICDKLTCIFLNLQCSILQQELCHLFNTNLDILEP